jgi:uncharacterized tellurite resistance protein B-like protein
MGMRRNVLCASSVPGHHIAGPSRSRETVEAAILDAMIRSAKEFFRKYLEAKAADESASGSSLAVAALLVEILRADFDASADERRQVLESLRSLLGLDATACAELLDLAERRIDQSHDLYQFTSEVNRAYSAQDKLRLVEQLWRVARADERVHKYEEHLIRRIADLLHVPHSAYIAAKLRSEDTAARPDMT